MSATVISEDGRYRYSLGRRWDARPLMVWCMLNPSTADANADDPTIRRCIRFALREGCGGIHVVNLMAYRATDPTECLRQDDPCGPRNDIYLRQAADMHHEVICAWGTGAPLHIVNHDLCCIKGADLRCLGVTKDGSPRHPLYVAALQPLVAWARPEGREGKKGP